MLDEIRDVILVLNFTGSRRFFHIFKPILPTSKPEPTAAAAVSVIPPNSPAAIAAAAVAASDLDEPDHFQRLLDGIKPPLIHRFVVFIHSTKEIILNVAGRLAGVVLVE
jgi:hypothetical protein